MTEVANLEGGDARTFEHGTVQTAKAGSVTISKATMNPGWRWSIDVKPVAKTDSCMVHHMGYAISGRLHVVMDDGTEVEIGPGEAYVIEPGHDAWVVGDEQFVGFEFESRSAEEYAKG
jgi:mannose-6-phosphate isomerase-like protein (cupin superfamily)